MTKEEILHIANRRGKYCNDLMIEIYKNIESRTCENCKHFYNNSIRQCSILKYVTYIDANSKDFGCNKWENKDG